MNTSVDIRKPYTEIGTPDAYSGRMFDERFIGSFVRKHQLDCNSTTAFLTPAFRNITTILTPDLTMAGNPPQVYEATLQLLTDVQTGIVRQELKIAFLALRHAYESAYSPNETTDPGDSFD